MIKIEKVGLEAIPTIVRLSDEIWKKVYPSVVPMGQIEYLLEAWHSPEALTNQITVQGHQFLLIEWDNEIIGYASYVVKDNNNPTRYRLNKLYVQPETHGKGIGRAIIQYIADEIKPLGGTTLELNVHKRNPAVGFYKHMGFVVTQDIITEIEHGYLLDDFVMELDLIKNGL
jgi:GNAT superfamily N-acetyltransferase